MQLTFHRAEPSRSLNQSVFPPAAGDVQPRVWTSPGRGSCPNERICIGSHGKRGETKCEHAYKGSMDANAGLQVPCNPASSLERATGIEPATSSLGSWHSAAELRPHLARILGPGGRACQIGPSTGRDPRRTAPAAAARGRGRRRRGRRRPGSAPWSRVWIAVMSSRVSSFRDLASCGGASRSEAAKPPLVEPRRSRTADARDGAGRSRNYDKEPLPPRRGGSDRPSRRGSCGGG